MRLKRVGVIGAGGIAELALTALTNGIREPLECVSILVPVEVVEQAETLLEKLGGRLSRERRVRTNILSFLADQPEVVAECASHAALRTFGLDIMRAGCDLLVISIGALADDELRKQLEHEASKGAGRIVLAPGAIGGIDALSAARLSGIHEVVYTGRKPPKAWFNTAAEKVIDLDSLDQAITFFEGTARSAAVDFPFNANVTATLALAGVGFDETKVRLVADPSIEINVHEFSVRANCGNVTVKIEGLPSKSNPKTSQIAGYSVARELLNRTGSIII